MFKFCCCNNNRNFYFHAPGAAAAGRCIVILYIHIYICIVSCVRVEEGWRYGIGQSYLAPSVLSLLLAVFCCCFLDFRRSPLIRNRYVCNADCDTSYSLLAAYRTHGHALGQAISTRCLPAGTSEFCPSCGCHVPESVPHALLACSHTRALTAAHLPRLLGHMYTASTPLHELYQSLSSDVERSRFILMAPCFPSSARLRRDTRRLVHE